MPVQFGVRAKGWNRVLLIGALALILPFTSQLLKPPGSAAASAPTIDAAQELANRYSPEMMIREQDDPLCGIEGEQYQVMEVDALFANPAVRLMRSLGKAGSKLIKQAPTRDDIKGKGADFYLDLPGDPLGDTCVFSRDFDQMKRSGEAPVSVYAHISSEEGRSGIALQYWFYWYFNQFNDLHESDWEGMQITFDADTPEEALEQQPDQMILFQHGGGERARWDDPKVEKDGDHPVVYPAAGSHATFYQAAVYPQNGWNGAGVGCDNTSEPLRELSPKAILLPDDVTRNGSFSWLSFDGRWGQKEKGFNNGPTGPQTKDQWNQPFTWMEQQRWSSPRMPGGGLVGPDTVSAFCGVMESVTGVLNLQQADPLLAYAIIVGFLLAVFLVFGFSKWRPADPDELEQKRAYGQIVGTSLKLYRRHFKVMAILGAISIPIVGGTQALGVWVGDNSDNNVFLQSIADLLLAVGRPVALVLVAALVIVFMRDLVRSEQTGVKASVRGTRQRFWRVVTAKLFALAATFLLSITIIGIPFAIRFLITWTFVQQEVLFTDRSLRESFRSSTDLVRGHWWRTVRTMVPLLLLLAVMGPLFGLFLIFTPLPLLLVNLIGSLVYALVIPLTTAGTTLLYFDLRVRQLEQGTVPRRSWVPWRPSTFGRHVEQPTT